MASENIIYVNLDDFDEKVIKESHTRPVIVDFWAEWCPPCNAISPTLDKIMADYNGSVLLAKLEVDEGDNMKLAGQYKVRGFPTIILFEEGVEIDRFSSAQSYGFIDQFIQQNSRLLKPVS